MIRRTATIDVFYGPTWVQAKTKEKYRLGQDRSGRFVVAKWYPSEGRWKACKNKHLASSYDELSMRIRFQQWIRWNNLQLEEEAAA